MSVLAVNYKSLCSEVESVSQKCIAFEAELRKLGEQVENLDIFWDGTTNEEFMGRLSEDILYMEGLVLTIRDCIRLVYECISQYQETEGVIRQIIGGMKYET